MLIANCGKSLIRPLNDSLRADIYPAYRRSSDRTSSVPCDQTDGTSPSSTRPVRGWALAMRTRGAYSWVRKIPTGFPDCTNRVSSVFERLQRPYNRIKTFPVARRFPRPTVYDQLFRLLGNFGIKVVVDHAEGRLPDANPCRIFATPGGRGRLSRACESPYTFSMEL